MAARHSRCATVLLCLACVSSSPAGERVEKNADGGVFRRYAVNKAGEKEGKFEEFDKAGKLVLAANFAAGKLEGKASYHEAGKLVREHAFRAGGMEHARTLDALHKTLADIQKPSKEETERALARLKAFRYLARVPFDDIVLDLGYCKWAQAGAELCKELKKLEHFPKDNPGWPEEKFKLGFKGTSSSSLSWGDRDLVGAIDGWMDDSDKYNIAHLGHRRWIIDPMMKKVGFGRSGMFSAMYTADRTRGKAPDYDYVAYPPPGFVPQGYFGKRQAWSVSVNPARFRSVPKDARPGIYLLDELGLKKEALELDHTSVDLLPFGVDNCVIFRPAKLDMAPGNRYLVEISGIASKTKAGDSTLRYVVEFAK